jgi:hypothetical protein
MLPAHPPKSRGIILFIPPPTVTRLPPQSPPIRAQVPPRPTAARAAAGSRDGVGPSHLHKRCQSCISSWRGFGAGARTVRHGPYRGGGGIGGAVGGGVGPSHLHKRCQSCISSRRGFGAGAWTVRHVPCREAAAGWWSEMCDSLKDQRVRQRILLRCHEDRF